MPINRHEGILQSVVISVLNIIFLLMCMRLPGDLFSYSRGELLVQR